jgi:hypothetical protein
MEKMMILCVQTVVIYNNVIGMVISDELVIRWDDSAIREATATPIIVVLRDFFPYASRRFLRD